MTPLRNRAEGTTIGKTLKANCIASGMLVSCSLSVSGADARECKGGHKGGRH